MKLAVIADTHLGARNASPIFDLHARRFFDEVFWPTCDAEKVDRILHLGDVFDHRRQIPVTAIETFNLHFALPARDRELKIQIIAGNHDLYYNDRVGTSGIYEITGGHEHITVHLHPAYDSEIDAILIPWITKETEAEAQSMMLEGHDICKTIFGHLTFEGMRYSKQMVSDHGLNPKMLKRFDHVWSGHFHYRQTYRNIDYLSTPYDLTWEEAGDWHGFGIWDTEKKVMRFFKNPHAVHRVLTESNMDENVTDCIVRVELPIGLNRAKTDKMLDKVYASAPADVKVIMPEIVNEAQIETGNEAVPETRLIISEHINARTDIAVDKGKLVALLYKLYDRAIADADHLQ